MRTTIPFGVALKHCFRAEIQRWAVSCSNGTGVALAKVPIIMTKKANSKTMFLQLVVAVVEVIISTTTTTFTGYSMVVYGFC